MQHEYDFWIINFDFKYYCNYYSLICKKLDWNLWIFVYQICMIMFILKFWYHYFTLFSVVIVNHFFSSSIIVIIIIVTAVIIVIIVIIIAQFSLLLFAYWHSCFKQYFFITMLHCVLNVFLYCYYLNILYILYQHAFIQLIFKHWWQCCYQQYHLTWQCLQLLKTCQFWSIIVAYEY